LPPLSKSLWWHDVPFTHALNSSLLAILRMMRFFGSALRV
jgi:hypothetical protein